MSGVVHTREAEAAEGYVKTGAKEVSKRLASVSVKASQLR